MSIDVDDAGNAAMHDRIEDAFDYKIAEAIARHVVESERYVLIEAIAGRICSRICQYDHVRAIEVAVEKLDASQMSIPSFTGRMKRSPQEQFQRLYPIDVPTLFKELETRGAASIPVMPESYRKALLEEAEMYTYSPMEEVVGPHKVREQLSAVRKVFSGSLFQRLKNDFELALWKYTRDGSPVGNPFNTPLDLNELVLQKYEKGSIGITPHRDYVQNINLICIFILTGKARFAICKDREGNDAYDLDTSPGNVIVMRAPGFMGSDFRPFHFISDVSERRIVAALRQIAPKEPAPL